MDQPFSAPDALRRANLRVTAIRTAVLDVVAAAPHAEAEAVRRGVVERLGSVSVQSIYDTLNVLREAGLLRRVELAGHPALYEIHAHDNHHHMACRSCGVVLDVACAVGRMPCLAPSETHGFVLDEAEVIYWGRCPACSAG
ncbi:MULTISPECIES: Fur family transcriptional regulator [unclassified Luteococcus]|uniref:Fur family transcriptional regulator n=1 Tax=unclassified Luteococcus TaxID=2639923 RepID=UPI00313E64E6